MPELLLTAATSDGLDLMEETLVGLVPKMRLKLSRLPHSVSRQGANVAMVAATLVQYWLLSWREGQCKGHGSGDRVALVMTILMHCLLQFLELLLALCLAWPHALCFVVARSG